MHKIIVVSHCILNKASKVAQDEADLADEYVIRDRFLRMALDRDVQLLQLPCPEFMLFGPKRWGHVKDQFDFPAYRNACREMLAPYILQLEAYRNASEQFDLLGVVSVEGSPSCGNHLTCYGDWGGELSCGDELEQTIGTVRMAEGTGVYMEELKVLLREHQIDIPILSLEEAIDVL